MLCRARTRKCSPRSSRVSPTQIVPGLNGPVTTVPLPRMVKDRSTPSRTRAAGSGAGRPMRGGCLLRAGVVEHFGGDDVHL